nr:MAG TPA: hypothetical protein [Caudoviricetes sp.]
MFLFYRNLKILQFFILMYFCDTVNIGRIK